MKKPLKNLWVCMMVLFVGGGLAWGKSAEVSPAAAVGQMKSQLVKELQEAMQKGGPENAIEVCHKRADEIAADFSKQNYKLGRTSHKIRNLKNAPPEWIQKYLDEYKGLTKTDIEKKGMKMAIDVKLPNGKKGYLEPLFTQSLCLTCHGSNIPPKVDQKLKALYPKDQARGFQEGEFRGFAWAVER